jgi:hypothetical protein
MESTPRSKFLDLSLEIRERIYEYAVCSGKESKNCFNKRYISMAESTARNATCPLFFVNKQIRFEAMNTHYHVLFVEVCRDVGIDDEDEVFEIREWLESFCDNVGALRHLVLTAAIFHAPELGRWYDDYDYSDSEEDEEEWYLLWRWKCHVDLAKAPPRFAQRLKDIDIEEDRVEIRKDMIVAVLVVESARRAGKLSGRHLRLLLDTFFSGCSLAWDTPYRHIYLEEDKDLKPADILRVMYRKEKSEKGK